MKTHDFLLELGTEELPPKLLKNLSNALRDNLVAELKSLDLTMGEIKAFATPRRLALSIANLQSEQEDQLIERKGPAVGSPERAIEGFARSNGVDISSLEKQVLGDKEYYFFKSEKAGQKTEKLLPTAVEAAINNIPITRAMQWGDLDYSFVRPVHWLVMLLDSAIVPANIMGLDSGKITRGLRFTGKQLFEIPSANQYQRLMAEKAQIEVDFDTRKEMIRKQVNVVANSNNATAVIDESLLDEVCALVEYPRAFSGHFDEKFLAVPEEALISAMKSHQKYFHMIDKSGNLLPAFISVANIESSDLSVIVDGNERVIRPRLADSEFFWEKDKAKRLEQRLLDLDKVLFMKSLGSMADKAKRIEQLSSTIAKMIGVDAEDCARAGLLAKTDLLSEMVGEFADLQGVMGGYYARNDGESDAVADAIKEHYQPRFAGDALPSTPSGLVVAIADKLDTITGIYGIGQGPTGSKDPYALRRLALGLLRIFVEAKLDLNLKTLIEASLNLHTDSVDKTVAPAIYQFMMERLKAYYRDNKVDGSVFEAVLAVSPESPLDFHQRVEALNAFIQQSESSSLIEANKRIANMLKDYQGGAEVDASLLLETAEISLFEATEVVSNQLSGQKDYQAIVASLVGLKEPIDSFFDNVMVNAEEPSLRKARLALISRVRSLFLSVADISYLSS
ncbi:MAG: glycine--tRNA ligase subunit beta [Gammaproteobacteria bacterium]|nr:glycine--tRNA ligase subunit beta [Gammaproteobacteria bacterium]